MRRIADTANFYSITSLKTARTVSSSTLGSNYSSLGNSSPEPRSFKSKSATSNCDSTATHTLPLLSSRLTPLSHQSAAATKTTRFITKRNMSLHSAACCTVPPIVVKDYKPKGEYTTVNGLKTYQTGDSSAKHGILVVYDIFGFFPQTIQGADILAYGDKDRPYQVFMPDFLEGNPADISWYPPDTPEKGEKLGEFFKTTAAPPKTVEKVKGAIADLKKSHTNLTSWGVVGYCWGGKIVNLTSQSGTEFMAAAACHPAMVDPADAPKITIPIALLPSKDEDKDAVSKYQSELKVKNVVEWFPDQVHGWMAARSDLGDSRVKSEYERGYKLLLDFFHANL